MSYYLSFHFYSRFSVNLRSNQCKPQQIDVRLSSVLDRHQRFNHAHKNIRSIIFLLRVINYNLKNEYKIWYCCKINAYNIAKPRVKLPLCVKGHNLIMLIKLLFKFDHFPSPGSSVGRAFDCQSNDPCRAVVRSTVRADIFSSLLSNQQ